MSTQRVPFVDLRRTHDALVREIRAAIDRVLDRGRYILDEEVAAFETEFARYLGSRYAVGVSSGTSALTIALMAMGVGPGDEVITVANTAIPTVTAIVRAGAVPVLVDVGKESRNIDVTNLECATSTRTRVIIPVHLYGNPCEIHAVVEYAARHGLRVIEDCAQAHGARVGGRKVGTFGDAGCFSFYPTKNLGAYGDGGMVVTDSHELAERARKIRHHGQSRKDRHEIPGMCARLDEIQAAILRAKLPFLDSFNERRREIAETYNEHLTGVDLPFESPGMDGVFHLYVVGTDRRDELRRRLAEMGIGNAIHYPTPVHLQKAFTFLDQRAGDFPVTENLSSEILSLPMFPELSDEEIARVIESVNQTV